MTTPGARAPRLPDGDYAGYLVVDGQLRELPVGSSFDPVRGAFYWQPGLGYVGNYDLMFVRTGADGVRERIPVRVAVQDRPTTALASRAVRTVGERQLRSLNSSSISPTSRSPARGCARFVRPASQIAQDLTTGTAAYV